MNNLPKVALIISTLIAPVTPAAAASTLLPTIPLPSIPYTAIAKTNYGDGVVLRYANNVTRVDLGVPGAPANTTFYADTSRNLLITVQPPLKNLAYALTDVEFPYAPAGAWATPGSRDQIAGETCTNYDYQGASAGLIACLTADYIPLRVKFVDSDYSELLIFEVVKLNRDQVNQNDLVMPEAVFADPND